jgi:POT family proton-dependent oligopeptide transporter
VQEGELAEKKSPVREIVQPFIDLVHAPRALWGVNLAYVIEGMVYFGMLNYLAMYFNDYASLNDIWAGWMVMILTAGITIAMFFLGSVADRKGVRFALLLAFLLMLVGRSTISTAPLVDSQYTTIDANNAGRNDPVFVFTNAEPAPAPTEIEPGISEAGPVERTEAIPAEVSSDASGTPIPAPLPTEAGESPPEAEREVAEVPSRGLGSTVQILAVLGILLVVVGYGMYQPGAYAAVRQFTTEKMGFAMLYALMNLGGWLPTYAFILRNNQFKLGSHSLPGAGLGILGTYWVYTACTVLALLATYFILSRRTVENAIASAKAEREREKQAKAAANGSAGPGENAAETPLKPEESKDEFWLWSYLKNHPLTNLKFTYFIFCLIPVQTLFAHNWLTLPMYVERAYKESWPWISQNFEPAVNFNPLLVFIFVPIVTALTHKRKVYNMMIIGTFVMAAPTFLLAIGPKWWTLTAFLVIMTLGEAMWQPRFLQYAAQIAPEGRTGAYMGVAQLPWFLTKMLVPIYEGIFLQKYCPAEGAVHTEIMWFIFGCIAITSPIMLLLAKSWVGKDFKTKAD